MPKKNTSLSRKINDSIKQGKLMPAVVVDVFNKRATIQLSGNGALLHNLRVIGGPVDKLQKVDVDFTTPEPTVVAISKEWVTSDELEKALKALTADSIEQKLRFDIVLFSGGGAQDQYPPTAEGLSSAVDAAGNGDVIFLPDVDIEIDLTIPEYVTLRGVSKRQSIIRGSITFSSGVSFENLCLLQGRFTSEEVVGITVPAVTSKTFIRHCEIHGYNCSDGNAVAVDLAAGAKLEIEHSVVIGDAANASAWAVRGVAGSTCRISNGQVFGKTDVYTGTGIYEYSNLEFESEIARGCIVSGELRNGASVSNSVYNTLVPAGAILDPSGIVTEPYFKEIYDSVLNLYVGGTPVLRVGDYIYFIDMDGFAGSNGQVIVTEYDIVNDTSKSLNAGTYYTLTGRDIICAGDNRKIYAAFRSTFSTVEIDVIECDFENDTVTNIKTWEDGDEPGFYDNPRGIYCLQDTSGNLHLVLFGQWENTNNTNVNTITCSGVYIRHYDFAADAWVTKTLEYNSNYYGISANWYFPPGMWEDKFLLFPTPSTFVAEDAAGNDLNNNYDIPPDGLYVMSVPIYDIKNKTFTQLYREVTGTDDWTGQPSLDIAAVSPATGEVIIGWQNGDGSNTYDSVHIYRWDIDTGNITHIHETADTGTLSFMNSDTELYIFEYTSYSPYVGILRKASDWSILSSNFSVSPFGVRIVDDQDRFWRYDETTEKVFGTKVTDDSDQISFDAPKSLLSDGQAQDYFFILLMGDCIAIWIKEGISTTNRVHIWLVK